jgi:hypothetical protein
VVACTSASQRNMGESLDPRQIVGAGVSPGSEKMVAKHEQQACLSVGERDEANND